MRLSKFSLILILLTLTTITCPGQMITGIWKGKINRQKAELKIIQNGDSLTGTIYYYESASNYRRYSIKGYFDSRTNEAVWWDDQLIEARSGKISLGNPGSIPLLSSADFNCPGGGKMMLDGKSSQKESGKDINAPLHFDKTTNRTFDDEWDYVIDNYTTGGNDPYIIDSVTALSYDRRQEKVNPVVEKPVIAEKKPEPVVVQQPTVLPVQPQPQTIEEKFVTRKKVVITEIPIKGDTIEIRFYDHGEIDGDSISLFLNNRLLFQHIRLLGTAYTIKIPVSDLTAESNELTMVAENLGSIPPNTSYMVAVVDGKRYEAKLESTEGSSAVVRFIRSP